MIRRPPRSTQSRSSAASDVYKRQGVEFEGFVRSSHGIEGLGRSLTDAGISTVNLGYTHALMNEWKIVPDGSVNGLAGYSPLELVTPKLFGAYGLSLIHI